MENDAGYKSENPVMRLYYFREAAREYLDDYNGVMRKNEINTPPLERMIGRLPYLLEEQVGEDKASKVLAEIAAPVADFLINIGNGDFAKEDWFKEHAPKQVYKALTAALGKLAKLRRDMEELGKSGLASKTVDKVEEIPEEVKESDEAQLFRREISGIIDNSKKYSDEEKEKMREALNGALEITYKKISQGRQMEYGFGSFSVVGLISDGTVRFGSDMRYSSGGAFDAKLSAKYKSKKFGKIITGKGQAIQNLQKKQDRKQRREENSADRLQHRIEDFVKKISAQERVVDQCFRIAVRSLDACFLLEEAIKPDGFIVQLAKRYEKETEWRDACEKVLGNVYQCPTVWNVYLGDKEGDSYNKDSKYQKYVDEAVRRLNGRQKISEEVQSFYNQFERLSVDDKGRFDARLISDEKLNEILMIRITKLPADLPLEVKKEAFRQEIFRQALDSGRFFDENKFKMMNRVLQLDGIMIQLKEKRIEAKYVSSSAQHISREILDDMHARGVVEDKHKMEAFLYHVGEYRRQHPDVKLGSYYSGCPFEGLVKEFAEVCCHLPKINFKAEYDWNCFINNKRNLKQADQLYDILQKSRVPGLKIDRVVKLLAQGKSASEASPLVQQSMHHHLYRRFAGLFSSSMKELKDTFNARGELIDTITFHPAFADVHNDCEHRFDMKATYLYRKNNGQMIFSTFDKGEVGDTLLMPVVYMKNKEGIFEPLMKKDMLVMTSRGGVMEPLIEDVGRGGKSLVSGNGKD